MKDLAEFLINFILTHPVIVQSGLFAIAACLLIMFIYIIFIHSYRRKIKPGGNRTEKIAFKEINRSNEVDKKGFRRNRRVFVAVISILVMVILTCVILFGWGRIFSVSENPVLSASEFTFGIDVSSYQRRIHWDQVITSHHPIRFVFIRATMGTNAKDSQFSYNWRMAKKYGLIRGAYHYYRPNENSAKQFANFASSVRIEKGDLPPVLDIEDLGSRNSQAVREGVLNWLRLAESRHSMKPILYTNRTFYNKYLRGHVSGYPLWIASYSGKHKLVGIRWTFHQFTSQVRVKGVATLVDGNDFNGTYNELIGLCKKPAP